MIKLRQVRVFFKKFLVTPVCDITIFGDCAIFTKVNFEDASYGNIDPHFIVESDEIFKSENNFFIDVSMVAYTDLFLTKCQADMIDRPPLEMFGTNLHPENEELRRYLRTYLAEFHSNIKSTVRIIGRSYLLTWFNLAEGVLGDAKAPEFNVPITSKYLKVGQVIVVPRDGVEYTPDPEKEEA